MFTAIMSQQNQSDKYLNYWFVLYLRILMHFSFIINGISNGRWLTKQVLVTNQVKGGNYSGIWKQYVVTRLANSLPYHYFVLFLYYILIKYMALVRWPDPDVYEACNDNIWLNVLLVSNIFSSDKMCIPWMWSNNTLFLFIIISPYFIIQLHRNNKFV
ncbi:uncharacterized protein LOC128958477 [Oppia nitens]|uniref:uncharacterized protein LOC128958477 n=1 Tax=Oppia nitens TaxID=1686743 RepID=UPI0023DB9672|nr:uncharacterized protein LOC128958477 [Oppia nitens]